MEDLIEFEPKELTPGIKLLNGSFVSFEGIQIPVVQATDKFSKSGWYGTDHPNTATAEWGREMLSATIDYFARFIEAFQKIELK